jgi:uncharacterized protein (DUF1778 family)
MSTRLNSTEPTKEKQTLRDARINLRGTYEEFEFIRRAAESSKKSLTEFVLESAAVAAERVLADRSNFVLDSKAWKAFHVALDRPAVLKPRLQALLGESDPFIG